jgi:hypothetical protein
MCFALVPEALHGGLSPRALPRWAEVTRRELAELQERLRVFDTQYQMPSETFYQRFRAGELGDTADMVEWSMFYEMW